MLPAVGGASVQLRPAGALPALHPGPGAAPPAHPPAQRVWQLGGPGKQPGRGPAAAHHPDAQAGAAAGELLGQQLLLALALALAWAWASRQEW